MNPEWSKGSAVGLRTLHPAWERICRSATNIFVSTILRKLDLGVSSMSSNQPEIMGPVSRFPKAFQNSKEHPTPPCAPGWPAAVNLIQIRIVRMENCLILQDA